MESLQIQEIKKKKQFLKRYKKNRACINRLEEKLKLLDVRIKSAKTSNFSGTPRGGVPVTMEDLIADKEELESRIKRLKKKGAKYKVEILEEIDTLEDDRYCEILEAFFIECLSFEDIADDNGYTVRHVYRLYADAIDMLIKNEQFLDSK